MNIATALVLGLEIGILLFCAGAAIGWRVGDREAEQESRTAARRAVDVPLRFERPAYTSSRTWGDA